MLKKYLQLALGMALIAAFISSLTLLSRAVPTLRQLQHHVDSTGSDHTPIFYTESETAKAAVRRLERE